MRAFISLLTNADERMRICISNEYKNFHMLKSFAFKNMKDGEYSVEAFHNFKRDKYGTADIQETLLIKNGKVIAVRPF